MQLRQLIFTLIILTFCKDTCIAQNNPASNGIPVLIENAVYENIFNNIKRNRDSLEQLNLSGVVFVQIRVKKGIADEIKFSNNYPRLLTGILHESLKGQRLLKHPADEDNLVFILPVLFDYTNPMRSTGSLKKILDQIPEFSPDMIDAGIQNDFVSFFNIRDEQPQEGFPAVKCYFMNWIRLSGRQL